MLDKVLPSLRRFVELNIDANIAPSDDVVLSPLNGDAGFRRYFRVNTKLPLLAVWAPVETEDSAQFCKVSAFLNQHGVRAPRVLAADLDAGFLLVEDFGDGILQAQLSEDSVDGFYSEALSMLLHLQSVPASDCTHGLFADYDENLLGAELALCDEWFFESLLKLSLSESEIATIKGVYGKLIERASSQVQIVVHRDFHCRNLIVLGNGSLATIDFQDAVRGPLTYDLVSLLKDCYIKWPHEQVSRWALSYASLAQAAGILPEISEQDFLRDFDYMGLQRHIKVLGIFARLALRDGKHSYLPDLPRVFEYVIDTSARYPELKKFEQLLRHRVEPVFKTAIGELIK